MASMTTIEKIEKLVAMCKGSVTITFNDNTTNYETVEQCLNSNFGNLYDDLTDEDKQKMIDANIMVDVHAYPDTPVGFYSVTSHSLDHSLDEVIRAIENDRS